MIYLATNTSLGVPSMDCVSIFSFFLKTSVSLFSVKKVDGPFFFHDVSTIEVL